MTTRILPKTELRERIRAELADLGDDTVLVTDRSRPVAVVVSVERWNELQAAIEDLEDAVAVLEHRSGGARGTPAEVVLSSIEADEADASGPAHKAG